MNLQALIFRIASLRRAGACASIVGLVLWSGGCGGTATVGTDVKKPAAQRPDVDRSTAAAGALIIPAKAAFNLTSVKSAQSGPARGTAELVANNGAKCAAEARDGGAAWGEFQLGYCFDNVTEQPLQAVVKLHLKASAAVSSTSAERAGARAASEPTQAAGSLAFCIKDTNGIVLKQEQLLTGNLEKGAESTSTGYERVFDLRFEPQRGYYLFVAGRVDAHAADVQSSVCSLAVSECSIEIDWQAAKPAGLLPAAPAADRPQLKPATSQ